MPLNVGSVILCQNWPSVLVCAASSANLIRGVCTTTISVSEPVSRCGALDYTAHAAPVNAPRPRLRCGRLQAGVQTVYGPGFQPGRHPCKPLTFSLPGGTKRPSILNATYRLLE